MFRAAHNPREVEIVDKPSWVREARTGSRRAGILFERRVLRELQERFDGRIDCNQWFRFRENDEERFCSPDAIIRIDNNPIVVEIKSIHCRKAWWQINRLYIPVLSARWPDRRFRGVEICGEFRSDVDWPEITLVGDVEKTPRRGTGVHVRKGR